MNKRSWLIGLCSVFLWMGVSVVGAYGPNVITPTGIVKWNLPVVIDKEADESVCDSNVDLSTLINQAAAIWSGAPETGLTTTIQTINDGGPVAVDENNFCDYITDAGACPLGGNINGPGQPNGFNPVIYDETGAITDLFFGSNARFGTLGFAGIVVREENSNVAVKGEGVINLTCFADCANPGCNSLSFSKADVLAFVTHEVGHFFGMNHTQVNFDQSDTSFITTMFALFDPTSGADITTLERDDQIGVAFLYPNAGNDLKDNFCSVTGILRDENGDEFQCANVIARNTDPAKALNDARSFVSGGDKPGGSSQAGRGRYTMHGLVPGETYDIIVQPIDRSGLLSFSSSGIVPCNGGQGNPAAPGFTAVVADTVTCGDAGDTLTVADLTLSNTTGNVSAGAGTATGSGTGGNTTTLGGCSLIRK